MSAQSNYYVPYVIEKTGRGERTYDIYSRLLEDRIIFIGTQIDDTVANSVMAQLLVPRQGPTSRRTSTSTSTAPGGSVTAGLAIYDTMQFVQPRRRDLLPGPGRLDGCRAAGRRAAKGKRFALPNSRIMIHQPWGGAQGTALDMEIQVTEILKPEEDPEGDPRQAHRPSTPSRARKDSDRDNFMSAEEAKEFGLIDHVVEQPSRRAERARF